MVHHRGARLPRVYERALGAARARSTGPRARSSSSARREPARWTRRSRTSAARRARRGRRRGRVRRALGEDLRALRARGRARSTTPGASARSRTRSVRRCARAAREVVFATQSETSTGVVADIQALKAAVGEAVLVVDAVSSLGAVPLETDAWSIDVVVSGSQKALMCPPGLAMASVAAPLWERLPPRAASTSTGGRRAGRRRSSTPRSPLRCRSSAGSTSRSGMLLEEGLEAACERHMRLGRATRAGAKAMGLELFSPDDDSSSVVTAIRTPEGVEAPAAAAPPARPPRRHARARARARSSRTCSGSATSAGSTSSTSPSRSRRSSWR